MATSSAQLSGHTRHVPELQSLRGLAATLVLIGHCIAYYATPVWWTFVKRLLNGQAQVEIFFILSGFVLTLSLTRNPIDRASVTAFYVKRAFRIYPALWFASALATVYVLYLHYQLPVPGASNWIAERFRADRFSPLYFIASWAGMLGFLIPPVWTIFVEIAASVLLPFIVFVLVKSRPLFWGLLAGLLVVSVGLGGAVYYRVDMYLFDFALGAALVIIDPEPLRRWCARFVPLGWLTVAALLLGLCTRAFTQVDTWDAWMQLYEALFLGFVVFAFGRAGLTSRLLQSRFLVWLGDVSYSVYLVHFTIMCLFAKLFALAWPELPALTQGWGAGLLLCVPTLLVTLPLSHWIYNRIEKPGIALGGLAVRIMADRGLIPVRGAKE